MKKNVFLLLTVLCFWYSPATANGLGPVSWISEQLLIGLRHNLTRPLHRTEPVLATSFVPLSNFDQGSPLGIMLGKYVAVGLTRYGYKVTEICLDRSSILIKPQTGEYILTRHIDSLENAPQGKVMLIGTYSLTPDNHLYVTARLVNSVDGTVLSSTLVTARVTDALRQMCDQRLAVRPQQKGKLSSGMASELETDANPAAKGPYASGEIFLSLNVSADVRKVQGRLKDLGLYSSKVDGVWGKKSQHALKLFKSVSQLPNPDTWNIETQKKLFYH